ncbi:hypothetical protein [Paraburkholderia youngii]|uniref:hypothetical protein n=1 Tax=Paraburkholderia youngii TaxID=2782701 RepID=UPI003D1DD880
MSESATFRMSRRTLRGTRKAPPGKVRHFLSRTFPEPVKMEYRWEIGLPEWRTGPKRLIDETAWSVGAHNADRLARYLGESAGHDSRPGKRELESRMNFRQQ